jgi:hypothetical protein
MSPCRYSNPLSNAEAAPVILSSHPGHREFAHRNVVVCDVTLVLVILQKKANDKNNFLRLPQNDHLPNRVHIIPQPLLIPK